MTSFKNFALLPTLQTTLAEMDLATPTEIQARAIPALLEGRSIVGISETGSGKTLAFALPILHKLKTLEINGEAVNTESQPRAAVIVPTRELGEQVSKVFKQFTHATRLRVRTVLGGTTPEVAKKNLLGSFEVLVATPGRLVRLLDRGLVSFDDVRVLVFDEADQMLDPTFLPDAGRIVRACPSDRQLALFSATVSAPVQTLVSKLFSDAETIRSEGHHKLVATLKTINKKVVNGKRFPLLETLLTERSEGGTLIFANTRSQCDTIAAELDKKGYKCAIYRGEMDKVERRSNLKAFRDGKVELLICTDVASRGLDVAHVGRVINYHLPQDLENYIHRAGRTARAGRDGVVINMVTERDQPLMNQLDGVRAKPRVKRD